MSLPRRRIWWIASALLLAMALHALTDGERLKQMARDKAARDWGRQLEIGTVSLDLFPTPSLHATQVRLSNPPAAKGAHLAQAAEVRAELAWLPLLAGQVELRTLHIAGLALELEELPGGANNWTLNARGEGRPWQQALADLKLHEADIENASIGYRALGAEPMLWQVRNARLAADAGLRNAVLTLQVVRDAHALQLEAKVADLSALGAAGAVSEGSVKVRAGAASLVVSGQLPLDPALRNYNVNAQFDAPSLKEAYSFFGIGRRPPVAGKGSATLQAQDGNLEVRDFRLQLGKLNADGSGSFAQRNGKTVFDVKLQADRVDMVQTFLDAGQPPLPPKPPGELFRDKPLPWPMLARMANAEGTLHAAIGALKLRSGILVNDARAELRFNGDVMDVPAFSGTLLGGTATGNATFNGAPRAARVNLQLRGTQLGQWLQQTGNRVALTAGPMQVDASVTANGDSMRDLAASMTGPVTIEIGPARILSQKASQTEMLLTNLIPILSEKDANTVALSCVGARLQFRAGVASGEGIAGIRSEASQLLTSGAVDLRAQTVDLHGRLRARSGINLGVSTFASQVKITGKLGKPQLGLDEGGALGAIARVGAAIFTGGASVLATAVWDGANPASDPCQIALSGAPKGKPAPERKPRRDAAPRR